MNIDANSAVTRTRAWFERICYKLEVPCSQDLGASKALRCHPPLCKLKFLQTESMGTSINVTFQAQVTRTARIPTWLNFYCTPGKKKRVAAREHDSVQTPFAHHESSSKGSGNKQPHEEVQILYSFIEGHCSSNVLYTLYSMMNSGYTCFRSNTTISVCRCLPPRACPCIATTESNGWPPGTEQLATHRM